METATIKCPTCGSEFPAGARFCPKCGYVVPPTVMHAEEPQPNVIVVEQRSTSWGPWILAMLAVLLGAGSFAVWGFSQMNNNADVRLAAASDQPATLITPAQPAADPPNINITLPPNQPAAPAAAPDINITVPPGQIQPPANPPAANPPLASAANMEIVSVSAEPRERGVNEWDYGYEFKLRNTTSADRQVSLLIRFLDAEGFVVDDDLVEAVVVPANSEKSFAGADMIRADRAATIRTVTADFR